MFRKALVPKQILEIGLAILVLVLGTLAIYALYTEVQTGIFANIPESKLVEEAIACSHLRCSAGCASPKIQQVSNIPQEFNCRDFCNAAWTDTGKIDGKICDASAIAHPVQVTLATTGTGAFGEWVGKVPLAQFTQGSYAISYLGVSDDNCKESLGRYISAVPEQIVYIDNSVTGYQNETDSGCMAAQNTRFSDCYSKILLLPNTYYIWTDSSGIFGALEAYHTILCKTAPEVSTTSTSVTTQTAGH